MITPKREKRFKDVIAKRTQDVIVLENIHDPHNALAAIRNCDAFGVQTAHFIFETEKMFNPEELGKLTSASANKWVDSVCWSKSADCFSSLKKEGFKLYATIIDPAAKPLSDLEFHEGKCAIIFGNEGFGISETAKEMSDELVYLPMNGFVDSINLSVSVGVLLYELTRQRGRGKSLFLSDQDRQALYDRWVGEEIKKKCRI